MNAVKKILETLKRQWRLLAMGLAALAGLGVGLWQFLAAGEVVKKMATPIATAKELQAATNQPMQNRVWIEEKRRETGDTNARLTRVLESVQKRQKFDSFGGAPVQRKPLVDEVLPTAAKTQPRDEFKRAYREAFTAMVDRLRATDKPTDQELKEAEEREAQRQKAEEALLSSPWAIGRVASGEKRRLGATDRVRSLWADARVRFSLERAKGISMYIDPGALRMHDLVSRDAPPEVADIWQAQMSLWIQRDIVGALADVNERAAKKHADGGHADRAWVAHLPIKRLISLSIAPFLGGPGGGQSNWQNVGLLYPSFTKRGNNEQFFMVPLVLRLVVETEEIPSVLDALVEASFMTPVQISYDEVRPNWRQIGYVYGQKPVVALNINLEAYYSHGVFGPFMPTGPGSIAEVLKQPITSIAPAEGGVGGGPADRGRG